jgi:uncharacterized membrane protein YeaQ/YmgE (transglycosylase-associated protein family)
MHFMWAMVIGFIAGTLASRLMPGHDGRHLAADFGIGIGVAIFAGFIGRVLGFRAASGHPGIGLYASVATMWILLAATGIVVSRGKGEPEYVPPPGSQFDGGA